MDDRFETVAVLYSLPEARVLQSMFGHYGIPMHFVGAGHVSVMPALMLGLGGIEVRVPVAATQDAREILREVATRPPAIRPQVIHNVILSVVAGVFATMLGVPPPPRISSDLGCDRQ